MCTRTKLAMAFVCLVVCALITNRAIAQKPDIEGKIVLANLDRYDTVIRFGDTRRTIKPKKATLLTPKTYPVTIEYWSGNTTSGWQKQAFSAAGVYGFNFKNGRWILTSLQRGSTTRSPNPPASVLRQRIVRPRAVRRSVTRTPINVSRARWSPLARVAWAATSIYQFVRDEQDRDLIRDVIIRGRLEDLRDLERWIDESDTIALPHKVELKDSLREIDRLSEADWKTIETADDAEWDQAKSDLGDLVTDDQWEQFNEDFADSNTSEFWEQDNADLDLNEIDFEDNVDAGGNIDVGDEIDLSENLDVGDLGIDTQNYDLGGFDDFGGYDGAFDVDAVDFGGGDFGGGDFADFGDADMGDFGGGDDFDF